jgi:hypothetical protein
MEENIKELFCKSCNYKTTKNTFWLKHLETEKHKRNGEKKSKKCDICDYESNTHWNIKAHKVLVHATREERQQQKYYCNLCDVVFFCKAYQDKHNAGRNHNVKVKVQESLNNFNNN